MTTPWTRRDISSPDGTVLAIGTNDVRRKLSMRNLWRQESWTSRLILVAAIVLGVESTLYLLLDVVNGCLGDWNLSGMADNFSSLAFAMAVYQSVYWRRRALNAEKPLPRNGFRAPGKFNGSVTTVRDLRTGTVLPGMGGGGGGIYSPGGGPAPGKR